MILKKDVQCQLIHVHQLDLKKPLLLFANSINVSLRNKDIKFIIEQGAHYFTRFIEPIQLFWDSSTNVKKKLKVINKL